MNDIGYIKFHRKTINWQWVSDPSVFVCFWLMASMANYKDGYFQRRKIKRGQLVTSVRKLADLFYMNERTIMRCLKCLEESGEIKIKHLPKYTIITICNYEKYQGVVNNTTEPTTQPTTQPTTNQRNKEIKNSIKERDSISYPSYTEVKAYADERGASEELALDFYEHYESNGWMVGNNPMKNWKASFNGWMRRHKKDDDPEKKEVTMNVL